MRNLEALSQFIVPLVLLAIWAVTSILNRDGQPLPRRPNGAPGPRPAGGPIAPEARVGRLDPLAAARAREAAASRAAPRRGPGGKRSQPSAPGEASIDQARSTPRTTDAEVYIIDEGMVVVDPVNRRAMDAARPSLSPSALRKAPRGRRGESSRSRPKGRESDTQRALSEQVGQSMAEGQGRAMTGLSPLSSSLTNLDAASLRIASVAAVVSPSGGVAALTAVDVRRMIAEPARLREIAVLSEILQAPVSRRPGRRV